MSTILTNYKSQYNSSIINDCRANGKLMRNLIPLFICCIFLTACGPFSPKENKLVKIDYSSNAILGFKSYTIPRGIFRGVLWPEPGNPNFDIWLSGDKFFKIKAPPQAASWTSWIPNRGQLIVKEIASSKNRMKYSITWKGAEKILIIELPRKKRKYHFEMLGNEVGEETIVFMDIDEIISDTGLFGYVVMK